MWQWLRSLRNRGTGDRHSLPYVDPLRAGRHPFQIYMLALCLAASLPYLFGYATAESVEKQLPVWLALAWGITLLTGSGIALVGSFWRGSIANALTMERLGLNFTGGAAVVYGLCVLGARSVLAPVFVAGIGVGYLLLKVPVTRWSEHTNKVVADLLTASGVCIIIGLTVMTLLTPALHVLVGAFIIIGFGLSCLKRAKDIARIFHRANESNPRQVLREGEQRSEVS